MTKASLNDRLEICDLLYSYARAIDSRDFTALDRIFTADAIIDYDLPGGARLPLEEMKTWLADVLQIFRGTQHVITNPLIEVDGGCARSTSYLTASHEQVGLEGRVTVFVDNGVYSDRLVRTNDGWRITERKLSRLFLHGEFQMPDEVERFTRTSLSKPEAP